MCSLFSRPLECPENKIPLIICENTREFYNLISDIHDQINGEEGDFTLSEDNVPTDMEKTCDLLIDLFTADCNQRKALTALFRSLSETAMSVDLYNETKELQGMIASYLQKLSDNSPYPVFFSMELPVQELLKAADLKFDFESGGICEKLLDYMMVMRDYCGRKYFIFCNLKTWIPAELLENFYQDILYRKLRVILLENRETQKIPNYEITRIIDADLCEID